MSERLNFNQTAFDSLSAISLNTVLDTLTLTLSQPIEAFSDPAKRLFIPFLFSSLLLIAWVIYRQSQSYRSLPRINAKAYWQHPSHLVDMSLWLFNGFLKLSLIAPLFISQLGASILVHKALYASFGDSPNVSVNATVLISLFTLAYFIFDDLTRFALHWAMHRFSCLWYFHKVHHSAEVLSPLTVYRLHPVEMVLYNCRQLITVGLVAGLFSYCFQGKITGWMILGVDAAGFIFNLMGSNLRHSHIWLSFGKFEKIFISPAMHQIHHSTEPEHRHKNFGSALSIWDTLIKSSKLSKSVSINPAKISQLSFGLGQESNVTAAHTKETNAA